MATATQSLRFFAARRPSKFVQDLNKAVIQQRRTFIYSARRCDDGDERTAIPELSQSAPTPVPPDNTTMQIGDHESADTVGAGAEPDIVPSNYRDVDTIKALRELPPFREPPLNEGRVQQGFMNHGEKANQALEDPELEHDDISSLAHGELEQHREYRQYARLAAWEMPLLSKMATPFVPPTNKQVLRFRYTTYMGEEHPAEKKVVLEFCAGDMPDLTPIQREKLKKLVGVRYNPETDIVKMSCEMFETQAQNKRYLGDLVDSLLKDARDPTDDFADIPLDTRHHVFKIKPRFPKEWRMSERRKAEIEDFREHTLLLDEQRGQEGGIIDGVKQIEQAHARRAALPRAQPVHAMAMPERGKPKAKRLAVRR